MTERTVVAFFCAIYRIEVVFWKIQYPIELNYRY